MNKILVKVDGKVIGQRKSPRAYTHAVVALKVAERVEPYTGQHFAPCDPCYVVISFHHDERLAGKGLEALLKQGLHPRYSEAAVFATEIVKTATRSRRRCTGLILKHEANGWARAMQCLKDAATYSLGQWDNRCPFCRLTDNAKVEAEAQAIQDRYNAERRAAWEADHRARYTAETCPLFAQPCLLHQEGK